jgi:hypothetical protein
MDHQYRTGFMSCYECPEFAADYVLVYQDTTTADACVDDDTGAAALAAQQGLGTLPVPGACATIAALSQSPLTPYCQVYGSTIPCCEACGATGSLSAAATSCGWDA